MRGDLLAVLLLVLGAICLLMGGTGHFPAVLQALRNGQ